MAGIDSFQQSGLNTSLHNFRSRLATPLLPAGYGACAMSYMEACPESNRVNAMTSEMSPLRISFIRTAVAAEYMRDGGVETRE